MKIKIERWRRQQGLASIVVLILLLLMSALIVSNSRALAQLRREILLTEQKQLKKFATPAPVAEPKTSTPTQR